ncbi:MAG: tetratricopeptide repeat protein [Planctomycetota bacterium]|nr:tetratricopeptide repeat protein [Planctomycetota bacterium]
MRILSWTVIGVLVAGGCAARRNETAPETAAPAATRPSDPATFTLDEIEPRPVLANPLPRTNPTTRPSLDAIQLYAQARAAQLEGNRRKAIVLLEKALSKDSESFELNYAFGQVYLGSGSTGDSATRALERAAAIRPDSVDVHLLLGRQHLAKGDAAKSIEHLRLAMQTSDYKLRPEAAAMVNLFLAKSLQQKGYDLAALEQYDQLLNRVQRRLSFRSMPELYYMMSQLDLLYLQIGELNEKHGRYEKALESYRIAAEHAPDNFEYQSHVVHALLGLNRITEARNVAAELVSSHRANRESVGLLKDVYKSTGQDSAAIDALREILKQRPNDRSITFALAEVYNSFGKTAEAEKLLLDALEQKPGDAVIVSRLFEFYYERGNTEAAARTLIEAVALEPDSLQQSQPMWSKLLRPWGKNRLRLPFMQGLTVAPGAQAAKLFLTARLAELLGRDVAARSNLEQAVAQRPPFAPAYGELLNDIMHRDDWSEDQKTEAAQKLIAQAKDQNRPELAAELRGMLLEAQKKLAEASAAFEDSIRLGNRSPGVQFALAAAMLATGKEAQGESLLWKIVRQWPSFDEAYLALFHRYLEKAQGAEAIKVLQTWLAGDPLSVSARLLQINVFAQSGNNEVAESSLLALFREAGDNPNVIAEMTRFFMRGGRVEGLISRLEEERTRRPDNQVVVDALVRLYGEQKRTADAIRVIDAMRTAAAGDTDRLYFVSQFYERIQHREMTEQVLREVLRIDPQNGPASNDLGYMWADEGRNLAEAEALIRTAVKVEPDNAAYLDSLGWVLYKRGQYKESRQYLDEATQSSGRPDPVVLDHLGDALYRLEEGSEAAKVWQRSLDRLSDTKQDREDLKKLLLQLKQKLRQHRDGMPVNVAPSMEVARKAVRAAN